MLELVELCGRFGIAADVLLAEGPATVAELSDPAARVAIADCARLAERARVLTDEPRLALFLGMQTRLSSHGFLGFAAMTAGTVREALDLAERFALTRTEAVGVTTHVEGDVASMVVEERVPLGDLREFALLGLLVGIWQIGRALTGTELAGTMELSFDEPAYLRGATETPSGRMLFGRPSNRLVFAASVLDLKLVTADPVAMQLARAQCERELASLVSAGGFLGRVRQLVGDRVDATQEDVAKQLGVSTRTLKRRLADQGTTFSDLVDDQRRQRALLLIENRELSVGEVAARLGYTEIASFTRAFRRWTGQTPASFRAR